MNWIWREKSDGSRALAYPVYLASAIAAVAAIAALHARLTPGQPMSGTGRRGTGGRGAEVGAITSAAALAAPIPEETRPTELAARSYRLGKKEGGAPSPAAARPEPFDAIDATLRPVPALGQNGPPKDQPQFAALPPTGLGEGAPRPSLLSYRDPSADTAAVPPRAPSAPSLVLPRGSLIPVFLLTTVDTSNPAAVLQFAVADEVSQHGRCRLRLGTHLLGKLAGRPMRGRLDLSADTVLLPDGAQRPFAARAVEADDGGAQIRPGLAAQFVAPPGWTQTVPYVAELATGFLGILQSRAQERFAIGAGGLTLQSSVPGELQGAASQAGSQAIADFTRARLREIEERYAAYYFIPAGTACWLQLDSDFVSTSP
jgi:hypothetical protein